MHKILALSALLLVVAATGCSKPTIRKPSAETLLRCPHCGVEYPVEEGMKAYEQQHHTP